MMMFSKDGFRILTFSKKYYSTLCSHLQALSIERRNVVAPAPLFHLLRAELVSRLLLVQTLQFTIPAHHRSICGLASPSRRGK
jgi:hypothetical protein